jgi:hypothetical protein
MPKFSPRRALAVASVAALGLVGVSGALWTDRVDAASTVDTGNLTVKVEAGRAYSDARHPSVEDPYADCAIATSADGKSVNVTVTDAYPGMWCRAWFSIKNEGTVAARVSGFAEDGTLLGVIADMNPDYQLVGTVIQPGATLVRAFDINIPASATEADLIEDAVYTYTQTFNFENVTL